MTQHNEVEAVPQHTEHTVASIGRSGLSLDARGLSKYFGDKRVLTSFDLEVRAGEFLAIVGRSGCGKSTFLRLLSGLDQPTRGRIAIGNNDSRPSDVVRMMYQEPRLLPWATVIENVLIGLGDGKNTSARLDKARRALDAVGLADRADDWPSVLSGGQRQRVALARALVSNPGIMALDEPLGALDALTRIDMQAFLETVWQAEGFTALMVTHDVSEAITLADRVVLIEDGSVTLDLDINLPRPRQRGSEAFAKLEAQLLDRLLTRRVA